MMNGKTCNHHLCYSDSSTKQKHALYWIKNMGSQGNALACQYTGHAYWRGFGTSKNFHKAKDWFLKAYAMGDPDSLSFLGLFFVILNKNASLLKSIPLPLKLSVELILEEICAKDNLPSILSKKVTLIQSSTNEVFDLKEICKILESEIKGNEIIVTQGAGNIVDISNSIKAIYK